MTFRSWEEHPLILSCSWKTSPEIGLIDQYLVGIAKLVVALRLVATVGCPVAILSLHICVVLEIKGIL